jgi:cytochrome oxidase assembly protein ShyY1
VPGYRLVVPALQSDDTTLLVDLGWVPADLDTEALHALLPSQVETFDGLLLPATPPTTPATPEREGNIERWPLDGDHLWGILPRALGPPYGAIAAARDVDHPWVLRVGERRHEERLEPAALPVTGYALPLPKVHHRSYAAQWFAIALLAAALWLWSCVRQTT